MSPERETSGARAQTAVFGRGVNAQTKRNVK